MTTHCCKVMDWSVRTRQPGVPEAEQSDASIEFIPDFGAYVIAQNNGMFIAQIRY